MLLQPLLLFCLALFLGVIYGMTSLGSLIYSLDPPLLNTLQAAVQRHVSVWLWDGVIVPLLLLPAWALPCGLGLLLLGIGLWRQGRG
jgi:hypothetical protein